ncbi:MAG: photosynthetic complex assembly protein PuhC [Pseudomonadota bacterium]
MSDTHTKLPLHRNGEIIPDWAAGIGAAIMIGTLLLTAWASFTRERLPSGAVTSAAVIAERFIAFRDNPDTSGGVIIRDAETGAIIVDLSPEEGGFLRGIERVVAFERSKQGRGMDAPFKLTAHADGRVALADPITGQVIDINAFGVDNAEAFAALL